MRVVAAVLRRKELYLLGLRPSEKRHGGLWEFPGGKVARGETLLAAARRELAEELDLEVTGVGDVLRSFRDDGSPFIVEFVETRVVGEPVAREHEAVGWFSLDEMGAMPLAPADAAFAEWLWELQASR